MLLLVFVENAFKHAKTTRDAQINIQITLGVEDKQLAFWVKNSHAQPATDQRPLDAYSGLGLANVQQRLELLYPNAYQLSCQQAEHEYSIHLALTLH